MADFRFKMADFNLKIADFSFKMADFSFKIVGLSLKMVGFSFKMADFTFKMAGFSFKITKMADFSFKIVKMADFSFKMAGFSFKIADFSFKRACLLQMVSFWGVLWGPPWVWRFSLKTVLGPYKEFDQKFGPVILKNLASKTCVLTSVLQRVSFWKVLWGPPLGLRFPLKTVLGP